MTTLAQPEQLLLEMVNRARLDPEAEAARLGITLNQYIDPSSPGYPIDGTAKQALAGSNLLAGVAENHSVAMRDSGVLNNDNGDPHNGAGDGTPSGRISAAGYSQNSLPFIRNENVAWAGTSAALTTAEIEIRTKLIHDNLFKDDPANSFGEGGGHRLAMLDDNMREVGMGEVTGIVRGFNAVIVTQNFGVSGTQSFLSGVVYTDTNNDDFYGFGEARSGVTVAVTGGGSDTTGTGGGWSVGVPAGTYTVTFSGGGLAAAVSATVVAGNRNAKIDLVNGTEIFASADTTLGANATELHLLGIANLNGTGNGGDNMMVGGRGNNILNGAGGTDTAVYSGALASYTITNNADGSLTVTGAEGTDTLISIEKIKFSDQTFIVPAQPVAGSVAIDDVSVTEGNVGTKVMTFTATRTGGTAAFAVNFATANGTATIADSDYVATSGTLNFGANVNTQTFSVTVNGDTKIEPNETLLVDLSGATNGATISDSQATGTILDDDAISVSINDVSVTEGNAGTKVATFTVTRTGGTAAFAVNFATANGSATIADGDYVANSGTLNFGANVNTQQISVIINGDTKIEPSETFSVNLSGATNGVSISDATGLGTIFNDDDDVLATPFFVNGKPVVLWQNDSSQVHIWTLNNAPARTGGVDVGPLTGTSWHIKTSADFNGDGKTDLLWQNDNSQVHVWTMDGVTRTGGVDVGPFPGAAWHIKDAADFTGDGKPDILFQNDDSTVHVWTMNGLTRTGGVNVGPLPGAAWHVREVVDLTGDGKPDILFQNDNGQLHVWTMNGLTRTAGIDIGPNPGPGWHIKAVADLSGDGKPDILWQNDNSQVHVWTMNGVTRTGGFDVGPVPGLPWHVKEVADYNADGKQDILFQNDSGAVHVWAMNGLARTAGIDIPPTPSPDWHVL